MKTVAILAFILIAIFALLRLASVIDPFLAKVFGTVMVLLGFVVVFALGGSLEELSGGAMEVGGALLVAGIVIILFI